MLTYQQVREFLEKIAQLFRQLQVLQEAQTRIYSLSLEVSQTCQGIETEHQQMQDEIDRTEHIGELIRRTIYEIDNPGSTPTDQTTRVAP